MISLRGRIGWWGAAVTPQLGRLRGWSIFLTLVLGLSGLFFYRLGAPGLMDPDEGRYAEIAREMLACGNYWLPQLNFLPYLEKPPLVYWLTSLSLYLGGLKESAARAVPAASAVLGALGVYWFGARLWGRAVGLLGAAITATSWGYFILGRLLTLDMPLTCCLTWGICRLYLAWAEADRRHLLWAYLWLGLGVLTKGPVALVLPALIMFFWLLGQEQLRHWRCFWHPGGGLIFLLLGLPWYLVIAWQEPGFLGFFLGREHLLRFVAAPVHGGRPFYYYLGLLPLFLLPWTFFLLPALGRYLWQPSDAAGKSEAAFLWVWAGVILLFFSLASAKLPPYILPALPPLALWLAAAAHRGPGLDFGQPFWRVGLFLWLIVGVGALLAYGFIRMAQPRLYQQLVLLSPVVELLLLAFLLGPLLLWYWPTRSGLWGTILVAAAICYNAILMVGVEQLAPSRSPKMLAETIKNQYQPGDLLLGYQAYSQGLSFYTGLPFILCQIKGELEFGLQQRPTAGYYYPDLPSLMPKLKNTRAFIFLPAAARAQVAAELGRPLRELAAWKKFMVLVTQ